MVDIQITGVKIAEPIFTRSAPDVLLSITVRTEGTQATGTAHLTENERVSLLTLFTAIEERLADEITRH